MHYPQPSRILLSPTPSYAQVLPGSPDSNADNGWQELLCAANKDWKDYYEGPPMSSASTSAGPTPSIGDDFATPCPSPFGDAVEFSVQSPDRQSAGTPLTGPNCLDARYDPSQRKVFVGGVPQDMTQTELQHVFSQYGPVKKAWLQRNHYEDSVPRNHRGFGFVTFAEYSAVEKVLGDDFSRFITLQSGRSLEVKRAVSNRELKGSGNASTPPPPATLASGQMGREHSFPTDRFTSPQPKQQLSWQPSEEASPAPLLSSTPPRGQDTTWFGEGSLMMPASFPPAPQQTCHPSAMIAVSEPAVMPLAFTEASECTAPFYDWSYAFPAATASAPPAGFWWPFETQSTYRNTAELEVALLEAMPEIYED